ncbi:MAG: hypothetical protein ACK5SQ_05550 [Chitinophagales bacterium]|jgi:hypothetical protein
MIRLLFISSIITLLTWVKGYPQSIRNPIETLKEKKEIIFGLDNRRTPIHQHNTVIYGLYSGISFGKKLRFKVGLNGTLLEVGKFIDENNILKKNRLFFATIGEEFDFYQYKKFGMTTYLQAGIGNNYFRQLNKNGTEVDNGRQLIIPIETGLHFSYDLIPFLGLKTGFGWRYVTPKNSRELGGYYVKLGFSFNLKKITEKRAVKKNKYALFRCSVK